MSNVTISVPVSGTCPSCGVVNHAQIPTSGPAGSSVVATANASCGACGSGVALAGNAVVTK